MKNPHCKPILGPFGVLAMALAAPSMLFAQSAPVDEQSLKFHPDPEKSEVAVDFRLVEDTVADDPAAVSVRATAEGSSGPLTSAWQPWEPDEIPATAWLIIIDNSDPRRRDTIAENVNVVREFIGKLPERDAFTVHTLARELVLVKPFGTPRDEALEAVAAVRPGGTEALVTLIHQSVREGIRHLKDRPEPRKAVLLLTDGIDETAGGPDAIEAERRRLIDLALEHGVIIHTLCYAERASAMTYFGPFREISRETGGVHVPAEPADRPTNARNLPEGSLQNILAVMQGAGRVIVNVAALKDVSPVPDVLLEVATESGRRTRIVIPAEQVTAALTVPVIVDEPAAETEDQGEENTEEAEEGAEDTGEDTGEDAGEVTEDAGVDVEGAEEETQDGDTTEATEVDAEEVTETTTEELDVPMWVWLVLGLLLVIWLVAGLKIRARKRRRKEDALAAEESAKVAAERDEEDRKLAMQTEQTRISEATKPLAWLEMCDDNQSRTPVTITSLKIGRGRHNDLVIRNDSVSGNHCVINQTREGFWTIIDLQSGNGTVVNDQPITQADLQHGDIIELGELRMRFLIPS